MTNLKLVQLLMEHDLNAEALIDVGRIETQIKWRESERRKKMNPLRRILVELLDPHDFWEIDRWRVSTLAVSVYRRTTIWGNEVVISNDGQSCSLEVIPKDELPQLPAGQAVVKR